MRRDAYVYAYVHMMSEGARAEGGSKSIKWCYDWLAEKHALQQWKRPGDPETSYEAMKASTIKRIYSRCKAKIDEELGASELYPKFLKLVAEAMFAHRCHMDIRVNPLWGYGAGIPGVHILYKPDPVTIRLVDAGAKSIFPNSPPIVGQ